MAQPGTIERWLASIMAIDVAGYSRLMGVDEVGTLSALKEHRRERIDPATTDTSGKPSVLEEAELKGTTPMADPWHEQSGLGMSFCGQILCMT
jgi:hypothetical protein